MSGLPEPFYQDDHATIYHADCLEILGWLTFEVIVTDPPYGINVNTLGATTGRDGITESKDYPPIYGDDKPFDPDPWLALDVPMILFGANHFASRLPDSPSWIIWDKLDGLRSGRPVGFNDQADCELAWTNLGGPTRTFNHRWMGVIKSGRDRMTPRRHPTEKPVELMSWCIQRTGGIVLDPFMGSGTTLRAAKDLNRKSVGIEISEEYCEIAARRMGQEVLAL